MAVAVGAAMVEGGAPAPLLPLPPLSSVTQLRTTRASSTTIATTAAATTHVGRRVRRSGRVEAGGAAGLASTSLTVTDDLQVEKVATAIARSTLGGRLEHVSAAVRPAARTNARAQTCPGTTPLCTCTCENRRSGRCRETFVIGCRSGRS